MNATQRRRPLSDQRTAHDGWRRFDVHRLVRVGLDAWRPSHISSGTTLRRAQAIASANYKQVRTSIGNFEQRIRNEQKSSDTEWVTADANVTIRIMDQIIAVLGDA